jgi:hypothetical protein
VTRLEAIEESLASVQVQLQRHQELLKTALAGDPWDEGCCAKNHCRHRQLFRTTLMDAVCTLEETRQAFKSKQLEKLRKSLIQVLAEDLEADSACDICRCGDGGRRAAGDDVARTI